MQPHVVWGKIETVSVSDSWSSSDGTTSNGKKGQKAPPAAENVDYRENSASISDSADVSASGPSGGPSGEAAPAPLAREVNPTGMVGLAAFAEKLQIEQGGAAVASGSRGILDLSVGSAHHETGNCKGPCRYFFTPSGCTKGQDCIFCHLDHENYVYARPCKSKRMKAKKLVDSVSQEADPQARAEAASSVATHNPYLQNKMRNRLRALNRAADAWDDERGSSGQSRQADLGRNSGRSSGSTGQRNIISL